MALLPLMFSDWWEDLDRPHHLFDQHFGSPVDMLTLRSDPVSDLVLSRPSRSHRRADRYHPFLYSLTRRGPRGTSTVVPDKDKFVVTLDVPQFHPDEIKVKVVGRNIVVEAKHEEKEDEHGWISRQFIRKYLVPNQCDIDQIETQLSSDGILKITAPKKEPPKAEGNERLIKIQCTGEPAITNGEATSAPAENTPQDQTPQRQGSQRVKKPLVKAA